MRLAGVRKRYGRGPAVLDGVDLDLVPGSPVVVLGDNGSGKSTLLRIAAGCAAPSAGRVLDRPCAVGYLPADLVASDRMPARAWLGHIAAIRGARRATAARQVSALLDELGFTGGLDVPMAQLSTGNAQKVGLAQAWCGEPGILVLDEPWSGLDTVAAPALDARVTAFPGPVLLADHTGRAAALPGVRAVRLRSGRLADEPAPGARAIVELLCPADPAETAAGLPFVAHWRSSGAVLTVRVPVAQGDALLAAALAGGCSVLGVRREDT